jgi:multidrug efflux system membrane fusion protein
MAADAEREAQRMADLFARDTAADRELSQARADSDAKAAQVRADEAMVERAKLELEYCTIRAPFAGRVGGRLAERGDVVRSNETPLVVVNQVRPIYVTFSVAETHLDEIRRYSAAGPLTVEIGFPPDESVAERGTLTFTDNRVDRNTGMIRLRGTFANEDGRMWPGQYVGASLILTMRPDAIVVPTKAVQAGPDGQFVFVVRADRTVKMSPVRVADTLGELSVVESGLTPGQQVVTDGQLRLAPGTEVRVLAGDSPGASQPAEQTAEAAAGGSQ